MYEEKINKAVKAIDQGPTSLKAYMDICAKCGTCAEVCPIYYGASLNNGNDTKAYNPAERSEMVRRLYRYYCTSTGKLLKGYVEANEWKDEDVEKWVKMFYECTACRRCATYCPMGIDNSVITRKARQMMDQIGKTPERMVKVIEVSLETGNTDGCTVAGFIDSIKFLEEEMKDETGIDIPIPCDKEKADVFFVPPSGDVLVNPEAVMGTAKVFYLMGVDWSMSSKGFDGANYGLFTGDDASMKKDNKLYVDIAKEMGVKTLMMGECGHAHRIMKFMMEKGKWWGELPFEVNNIMQYTAGLVKQGKLKFDKSKIDYPVTYHDPCNFGRSCGIVDEPRTIINACVNDFREMEPHGSENWCCGGGGGLSAMDTIRDFRMKISGRKKVEQIKATKAKFVSTACSNCKRQLTQLMEYNGLDLEVGGVHDLISRSIIID